MVLVMFVLAMIEIGVVHFLVSLWKPWVAAIFSLTSVAGAGWILAGIWSFRRLPVELEEQMLRLRAGIFKSIDIDLANVSCLETHWETGTIKRRSVLNLALIAHPNLLIGLKSPVSSGGRLLSRPVSAVAHRFDDLDAVLAAVGARIDEISRRSNAPLPCKDDRLIRE